jgi:hypothetical protein
MSIKVSFDLFRSVSTLILSFLLELAFFFFFFLNYFAILVLSRRAIDKSIPFGITTSFDPGFRNKTLIPAT